ncbi:zf-HC2 domain-containing protein [candidate division KSB1 bacterium]|nr:zf-HC2 domain-containing protein [candidate division KSB1 bacterium]
MKCKSIEKMLSAFAADELNFIQKGRVRWHVRRCESCCAELSVYTKTREQVQATLRTQNENLSDEPIWPQIGSRVKIIRNSQKKSGARIVPLVWRKAVPVLAGAFVLLISLWIHHARQSPAPEILRSVLPLVEDFHEPGVTMMTFETDDPTISIVWFFKDDEVNLENKNGGV